MVDALCMAQTARSSVIKAANPSARNALEFGVTTARALRSCLGDAIPAYQLLAEGMRFEARLAVDAFGFDIDDVFSLDDRLDDLGVEELPFELEFDRFLTALKETRFKRSNRFMFSLPRHVGTVRYATVEDDVLERHARAYLASRAELMGRVRVRTALACRGRVTIVIGTHTHRKDDLHVYRDFWTRSAHRPRSPR